LATIAAADTPAKGGLGTTLVKALAQDLDAEVEVVSDPGSSAALLSAMN
jgi:two-component sensor histidine kinase